jgi:outer membrane protein TolC
LVEHAVAIARARAEATVRTELRRARTTWARARYLATARRIAGGQAELVRTIREVAQARFQAGRVGLDVVLALEARLARLEDQAADAQRELAASRAALRRAMHLRADAPLAAVAPYEEAVMRPRLPDALASWRASAPPHPDVRALRAQRARAATLVELVETLGRPPTDLGTSRLRNGADGASFGKLADAARPSPWYGLQEAYRAELAHRASKLEAATAARADELAAAAVAAWQRLRTAAAELTLQRETMMTLTEQAVRTTTERFRTGAADVDRVLTTIEQRLTVRRRTAAAHRDADLARVALDAILGAYAPPD